MITTTMTKKYFLMAVATLGVLLPFCGHAAVLTVTSSSISLDTQGESVNAVEIHLVFDPADFSIQDVTSGGSVVNLWVEQPIFSNDAGTLDLSGIVPGGLNANEGDVINFSLVPKRDAAKGFAVTSAKVLLNDGKGTPAALSVVSGPFVLAALGSSTAAIDTQAPDPFTPEIAHSPDLMSGQYFLVFAATDQHSGIDHYEVLEVLQQGGGSAISAWQEASSPYLLHDQTLSSDIYVRAVDRAGNFRVVKIHARFPAPASPVPVIIEFAILLIGIVLLVRVLWQRKK